MRQDKNLTQEKFAEKLGTSLRTVQGWEREGHLPNTTHRKKLCEFLNIPESELFGPVDILREPVQPYFKTPGSLYKGQNPLTIPQSTGQEIPKDIQAGMLRLQELPIKTQQRILDLIETLSESNELF